MTSIVEAIRGNNIKRVKATCGDCEEVLCDTARGWDLDASPPIAESIITAVFKKHRRDTGHTDFNLDIEKPTPREELDVTVTVNEVERHDE